MRCFILIAGLLVNSLTFANVPKPFNKYVFEDAVAALKKHSLYELKDEEIYKAALTGVLDHIESMNHYRLKESWMSKANKIIDPTNVQDLDNELKGEMTGIGVGVEYKPEHSSFPLITSVGEESGAKDADLVVGDLIVKIDDKPIKDFANFESIVFAIRGPIDSIVKLNILRDSEIIQKEVIRKKIIWQAVSTSYPESHIPVINLRYSNEKTVDALKQEIQKIKNKNIDKLILDLRFFEGGSLEQVIKIAELFSHKDDVMFRYMNRDKKIKIILSKIDGIALGMKIVVLINEGTRGMGEVLASVAIKSGGILIGEPSFGKATMESVQELSNGYASKFSVAKLFDAEGKSWEQTGLMPSIIVKDEMDSSFMESSAIKVGITLLNRG